MRRLVILVLLVILVGLADVAVKTYAEDEIKRRAEARSGGSAIVNVLIESFPFVPGLLASGSAGDVEVTIRGFVRGRLRVASLRLVLEGLRVDQERLRASREVEVTGVDSAQVTAELSEEDLARATGLPATIGGGEVRLSAAGRSVVVTPRLTTEGALELRGAPQGVVLPGLARAGLTGCTSTRTGVRGDRLVVECRTDDVPPVLLRAAATRAASASERLGRVGQ